LKNCKDINGKKLNRVIDTQYSWGISVEGSRRQPLGTNQAIGPDLWLGT